MGFLRAFERAALDIVERQARKDEADKRRQIAKYPADADRLVSKMLQKPVTINFHPDRLSGNGRPIIENLLIEGRYLGQFQTGTTNGGKTAYVGGDRFLWEQRLFSSAYPADTFCRPKYGALNVLNYLDGASARFGSCYFTLKQSALKQCTFAYGDSSTNPETLCTIQSFYGILSALLADVADKGRLLNIENCSLDEAFEILESGCVPQKMGRNLDFCIETHIHGDVLLGEDIEALYLDGSYKGTEIQSFADALSEKYPIALRWIPKRQIRVDTIDENFRGPMMKPLARRIDLRFGGGAGVINAALLGKASCESVTDPGKWSDMGSSEELFQYFKQLWHTTAYFGFPAQ